MSVLVEGVAVVVRRSTLDLRYPGGSARYLWDATPADPVSRLACADAELASVCFFSPDDCTGWLDRLSEVGIDRGNDQGNAVVCVDERTGPTTACDWIDWRRDEDGFTCCWLAGRPRSELAAPPHWSPAKARVLSGLNAPDPSGRLIRLAEVNGLIYWLDLDTGQQIVRHSSTHWGARSTAVSEPEESPDSLLVPVTAALDTLEWKPELSGTTFHIVLVNGSVFRYRILIDVNDALRTVVVYGVFPVVVPAERRLAAAELITRLNWCFVLGTLELDFSDGEIRYRTGCDVEGGSLTPAMVLTMLGNVSASVDRYGGALMRVVFGGEDPAVVAQFEIDRPA